MRTFFLLISLLAAGMAQQLYVLSGADAAISDANVMGKPVQAAPQEQIDQSTSLDGVLFDVWEKQGALESAIGVYYYDLDAEEIIPVLPTGFALQDVSADQTWMLASQSSTLWLISLDDSTPTLISDTFSTADEGSSALFTNNSTFVYLQQQDGKPVLHRHDIHTAKESRWLDENILPLELLHGMDGGVWVRLQLCNQGDRCNSAEQLWLIQDNTIQKLTLDAEQFWPATSDDQIAYANPSINSDLVYFAETLGFASRQLWLSGSYTLDAHWHNDARKIALLRLKRDFDTHEVTGIGQYLVDTKTLSVIEYAALNGLLGQAIWRDENTLLVIFTQEETGTFQLAMAETHIRDGSVQQLSLNPAIQSDKMIFVSRFIGMTE